MDRGVGADKGEVTEVDVGAGIGVETDEERLYSSRSSPIAVSFSICVKLLSIKSQSMTVLLSVTAYLRFPWLSSCLFSFIRKSVFSLFRSQMFSTLKFPCFSVFSLLPDPTYMVNADNV